MNKKMIAFALILLIAMGGLFAALSGVDGSGDVTAYLIGIIGEYFNHGFIVNSVYKDSLTLEDINAFGTNPEFTYGFDAKHNSGFQALMTVSAFEDLVNTANEDTVPIANVSVKVGNNTINYDTSDGFEDIPVLKYIGSDIGTPVDKSALITVIPGDYSGAAPGEYTSTVTVTIDTLT